MLTEQADPRYLAYLQELGISYLFAGKDEIDTELALGILGDHIGADFLLLEGGSILDGYFLRADCVDELSLVQAPVTADADAKPLFTDGVIRDFELSSAEPRDGALVMRYTVI